MSSDGPLACPRALLEALNGQAALLDEAGRIRSANRLWLETTCSGCVAGPGLAAGTSYLQVLDRLPGVEPGIAARVKDAVERALGERAERSTVEYRAGSAGSERWYSLYVSPVREEERSGALLLHTDVTEPRRAQEALRRSEARLSGIVDNTPNVAIEVVDREGRVVLWNQGAERMYGWRADEALGKTLDQLILDDKGGQEFLEAIQSIEANGEPIGPSVWEVNHKDGRRGHAYSTVFGVPAAEPPALEYICMDVDISDRVRAEEASARMVALLEATTDYVGIADIEGRALYLNHAARERLGIPPETDIRQLDLRGFYAPWAQELLLNKALPAARRDGSWSGELALIDTKGGEIPVSQVILVHEAATGAVEFVSTIARDLSERKALEAQLLQSQKMEGIGRLAGGLAHDFNNLLTAILGCAEITLETLPPGSAVRENVEQILKATHRASELTRQLLTFARKQLTQLRLVNLNQLMLDTNRMLRRLIGEDVELVTIPGGELPAVKIDPGQFEQILINLAVNARDAMPAGGRLTISTELTQVDDHFAAAHGITPGPKVRLSVSDTGTGMNDEVLAHIFEPFFTTKEPGKGTGLGLATCYGLVKQFGGVILARSTPGAGSTFELYLPPAIESAPEASQTRPPAPATRGHETVLLVEDEPLVRELAVRVLEQAGYRVLLAQNGGEALALARKYPGEIHLLITDMVMPQMGGRPLAQRLVSERPDLVVLYISGYTEQAPDTGVPGRDDAFLAKPFTPKALTAMVRELLDRRARRLRLR